MKRALSLLVVLTLLLSVLGVTAITLGEEETRVRVYFVVNGNEVPGEYYGIIGEKVKLPSLSIPEGFTLKGWLPNNDLIVEKADQVFEAVLATVPVEEPAAPAEQPEAPAAEEQSEEPAAEEQPEEPAAEEQPEEPAAEEQPEEPAAEEQPEAPAAAEQPETPAAEEQSEAPAAEEQPEAPAAEEQPEAPAAEEQPEAPAAEEQPEAPAAAEQPEAPAAEEQPEAPAAEEQPEAPAAEEQPEEPAAEEQPEVPAAEEQPEAPAAEEQPEAPAAEEQPEAPAAEEQPEAPAAEEQPEAPAAEEQPEAPAAEEQPEAPAQQEKPGQSPSVPTVDPEVSIHETMGVLSETSSEQQPAEAAAVQPAADTFTAQADTDIREQADGLSPIFATVPAGTALPVLGAVGDWLMVSFEGAVGYIYAPVQHGGNEQPGEAADAVEKKVVIFSSRRSQMTEGEPVTLSCLLQGFDGYEIRYQWECDDGTGYADVPGANSETYVFQATAETLSFGWRLRVLYR